MNFAKLINNNYLEYAPSTYIREDGAMIVNFNKNETLMRRYGFKLVVESEPAYNPETEYLTITGYVETENDILTVYTVNKHEIVEKPEGFEEKVIRIEKENAVIKEELAMTQAMVNDLILNSYSGGNV